MRMVSPASGVTQENDVYMSKRAYTLHTIEVVIYLDKQELLLIKNRAEETSLYYKIFLDPDPDLFQILILTLTANHKINLW